MKTTRCLTESRRSLIRPEILAGVALLLCGKWAAYGNNNSDAFFTETFDNSAEVGSTWHGQTYTLIGHGSGTALSVTNTAPTDSKYLTATLPAAACNGRRLTITGQVKATNVSPPPLSYNGVKLTIHYTTADGQSFNPQAVIGHGTFDWKQVYLEVALPANVTALTMVIGLESASGTACFDEIRVESDPIAYVETFDDPAEVGAHWQGQPYTLASHGSGSALSVTNTAATDSKYATASLPVAACNGRRLLITGQVKAINVSQPPHSYSGVKFMIHYITADGQNVYPQAVVDYGTFDWKHVYLVAVLPTNVTSIVLTVGLELASGTVEFDNVQVESTPMLYSEYFDDAGVASRWTNTSVYSLVAHGGGQAMQFTAATAGVGPFAVQSLPYAALRGQTVTLQAMVKAGISAKPASYNGVVVELKCGHPDGTFTYPQLGVGAGTFDWTKCSTQITIPPDIVSLQLVLGLEDVTGTATIDDVMIKGDAFTPYWTNPTPNYVGHSVPRLRGTMVNNENITASDLSVLASWNANLVRWPLGGAGSTYADGLDLADYDDVLAQEEAALDAMLPNLAAHGMAVTLDLHALSQHEFDSATNQQKLIDTWRGLAARYKDGGASPYGHAVWAYDIMNEPDDNPWTDDLLTLSELSELVALNIRDVDPTKTIVVEPYGGAITAVNDQGKPVGIGYLKPVRTGNVVYSVHYYSPTAYVTQGLNTTLAYTPVTYPGPIGSVTWNSAQMRAYVQPVVDFQNQYQVSIYIGEFSVIRWAPGGAEFLSDCVNVWESLGWDWSYHCFREWEGWDLEVDDSLPHDEGTRTLTPTDRQTVITNGFAPNVLPAP